MEGTFLKARIRHEKKGKEITKVKVKIVLKTSKVNIVTMENIY